MLKNEIFPGGEKVINNANLQIFTGPSRASFLIQKLPPCFQIIYHFSVQTRPARFLVPIPTIELPGTAAVMITFHIAIYRSSGREEMSVVGGFGCLELVL